MSDIPPHVPGRIAGQNDGLSSTNVAQLPDARRVSSSSSARTHSGSSLGTVSASSKIAIPRQRMTTPLRHGRRVPRACASCHTRKTKCSGDTPVCRQCQELKVTCVYPPALREKMKMQQEDLSRKLKECLSLLGELEPLVSGRTAKKIKEVLQRADSGHVSNERATGSTFHSRASSLAEMDKPPSSSSSVGSLDALDQVENDINLTEESRATGHLGKSSEITWMQRLQQAADDRRKERADHVDASTTETISDQPHDLNYHLDDLDIHVSEPVQKYWVPPRQLADKLFETYLLVAHPYFPIINRSLFSDQYRTFFDTFALPGDKWMAILNIIFAIAANYAHVAELDWRGNRQDHLLYLTRARMLSIADDDLFRHPDLQQVQVEGLVAFYLLSTEQIHRAWRISGLAIRSAVSLGINLKNSSPSITAVSKEIRNRVWWSIFIVENKLGMMTGRPTCVWLGMCSSPFPLPWDEAQLLGPTATSLLNDPDLRSERVDAAMASSFIPENSMERPVDAEEIRAAGSWLREQPASPELCFLYTCDITMVTQEIMDRVYAIRSANRSWSILRDTLTELKEKVDVWSSSLPGALNFTLIEENDSFYNEKVRLAFQYHGAKILLGRPCVCRHKSQTDETEDFNRTMAQSALESAAQISRLIPDGQTSASPYRHGPWWCLLHSVMQAVTIMILEISLGSIHISGAENNLLELTKKCIRWLYRTSEYSIASRRAWQLCDMELRRLADSMGFHVSDLSSHPYWQGKRQRSDYFGFAPLERRKDATVDIEKGAESIETEPATLPARGLSAAQSTLPASKMDVPGSFPSASSVSAEHRASVTSFIYGPLGHDFIQAFFPELGSSESLDVMS